MTDKEEKRLRTQLRQLLKIFKIKDEELRALVAKHGYYPAAHPIENYDAHFVSWLVNNWDTVRILIIRNRG